MAKLVIGAMFGVVVGIIAGAAAGIHADGKPDEDLAALANEAGIPDVDLIGALNSQPGVDARQYLVFDGLLEPPKPPFSGAVWRADCIIDKESRGLDVPNRQGSGAWGPGQYFPGTWLAHTALYRAATGYSGSLSLHSLADVRRVMAWILGTYPYMRSAWSVGGC